MIWICFSLLSKSGKCFHRRIVVGVVGVYECFQSLDFSVVVCDNGVRSKWVVNGYWVVE